MFKVVFIHIVLFNGKDFVASFFVNHWHNWQGQKHWLPWSMTIKYPFKGKRILELSPSSESHRQKKGTQTLFSTSKNTLCYLRMFLFNHQRELTNCTSKKQNLSPYPPFDIFFFKATTITTKSIATFQSPNPPSIHPSGSSLQCQRVEEASPPSVASSRSYIVVCISPCPIRIFRPASWPPMRRCCRSWRCWRAVKVTVTTSGGRGRRRCCQRYRPWWERWTLGVVEFFLVGRKYDKPQANTLGCCGLCVGGGAESNVTEIHKKLERSAQNKDK